MNVEILQTPYDSGHRAFRAGRGPAYLFEDVVEKLAELGHEATTTVVEAHESPTVEIRTTFALNRQLAEDVYQALSEGSFPLVLAGNCNSILGTLGGVRDEPVGLVFFDGHGDFNTPDTTTSGFLDGMGLATAVGRCWRSLAASIPGFRPLSEDRVVLVGSRDLDPLEKQALEASEVTWISASSVRTEGVARTLEPVSKRLGERVEQLYLHFDMDVLDPDVARANRLSPPDGLTLEELLQIVRLLSRDFRFRAASIASVEPDLDEGGKTLAACVRVVEAVISNTTMP